MLRPAIHVRTSSLQFHKARPIAVAFMVLVGFSIQAQVLVSAVPILEHDTTWLRANGVPDAQNGVTVLKLTYQTSALDGSPTIATAAFVDPQTDCATPLVCFIHGTVFLKDEVPSNWTDGAGSSKEGYTFGGSGMACVLPDLLGLGDSPGLHPYLHAASEATASIDAVRAAREYRVQQGRPLHEQLFLMGASAGSHACLATAHMMQTEHPDEFHISAAGGISGPYAPYPVIKDQILSTEPYGAGADIIYVLFSYNSAYPELFNSASDFLVQPYATELPPLYDGQHDGDVINPLLPAVVGEAVPQTLKVELATDPNAPLNLALKENNVFNWTPEFPVKLCYCGGDDIVPPINTTIAKATFMTNGATQISTVEVSDTANHTGCGELARPVLVDWFRSMKVPCDGIIGIHNSDGTGSFFTLVPNPVSSGDLAVDIGTLRPAGNTVSIIVFDAIGQVVYSTKRLPDEQGEIRLTTNTWAEGTYTVQVRALDSVGRAKLVVLR